MSEECNHDCASCASACGERENTPEDLRAPLNQMSRVKHVIAVVSGKGGVGKSLVTSMLAVLMQRAGYKTAILDADLTGPSIPKAFGVRDKAMENEWGVLPAASKTGIKLMSINLLLENETDPVLWRGPIIAGTVRQFWTDIVWGDIDYMFVDMPPGTGDVPLTVFQSLPVDGAVIVTSPQQLVGMIVEKAVKMAKMMDIPVLGLVENMSYYKCPDCGKEHAVFGESRAREAAAANGIGTVCRLPIDPKLAAGVDAGLVELFDSADLDALVSVLEKL
ncbi:MAG: Mrp/NBP35 family ATP-binding protein [Oscillospiraceae bacterium]|nr:Mrp/NBP35 family ATP-binding protein [Oscillospiraceae bacterium]